MYYIAGLPIIDYGKNIKGRHYTKEELQSETDKQLIKHLDVKDCKISDELVNQYFKGTWNLEKSENKFWEKHRKEKIKK
jgi:hypothetical protein